MSSLARLMLVCVCCMACASRADDLRPRSVPPGYTGPFAIWWNDAQMREQGSYLDGRRQGPVRTWYPDGTLASDGTYEAGQPEGRLMSYDEQGLLRLSQGFERGLAHGLREEFHADGSPALRQRWEHGLQVGLEERWHRAGVLATRGLWKAGLPSGRWEHFGEAGLPQSRQWFWVAGGVLVGTLESRLDPQTGRVTVQTLDALKDGFSQGWTTFWHANGQQAGLVETRDGRRHGRDLAWDEQGRLVNEGRWELDQKVGLWRVYDPPGQLADEQDHGSAVPLPVQDPHGRR